MQHFLCTINKHIINGIRVKDSKNDAMKQTPGLSCTSQDRESNNSTKTEQKIEKLRCTPLSPAQTLTRMTHPPIFPFAHHVLPVIKNIGLELGSDLCDYSNAYIVVKGITTV